MAAKKKLLPPSDPNYVGRGRPPVEHRFKKGVSGNPAGRPKGRTSFLTKLEHAFDQPIDIGGGKFVSLPVFYASTFRSLLSRARDTRAHEFGLELMITIDDQYGNDDAKEVTQNGSLTENEGPTEKIRALIDAALSRIAARAAEQSGSGVEPTTTEPAEDESPADEEEG